MIKLKSKFVLILIILCSLSYRSNSELLKITLDKAIDMALANNTETKIARMEIEKAEAAVDEAYGYALPTIDLSANLMHYFEKPIIFFPDFEAMLQNSTYGILFQENVLPYDPNKFKPIGLSELSMFLANSFETKLQVSQILFNSSVIRGIGASKIYLNLSQESLKSTASKTIVEVKKAFYGILLTQELLNIMKSSLANAEDNLNNIQSLYNQGLVSEFDLLSVQVQIENLKPTVTQLENALVQAKDGLKILLGIPKENEIEIDGQMDFEKINLPDQFTLIEQALKNNYDLKTLTVKQQIDEEFIELDRAEYWPTVAAFASYSLNGQSDDFNFQNYNTGIVGLTFSINLFNGLRTNEKVQQSTITAMQTKEQLEQLKEFTKLQVSTKYNELKRILKLIDAQTKNIELAEKAYNIAKVKYNEGTATQLEVQNADLQLRQAKTNKLQSVYDFIVAKSELDKLTGNIEQEYISKAFQKLK